MTTKQSTGFVRLRFQRNEVNPRAGDSFIVNIVDDSINEPNEYFEVYFNVDVNGYPFPGVARVTIVDDDGTAVSKYSIVFLVGLNGMRIM